MIDSIIRIFKFKFLILILIYYFDCDGEVVIGGGCSEIKEKENFKKNIILQ